MFISRFDIRGLSPGSSEDEPGIKAAAELRKCFVVQISSVGS